jgi:hypothetical protein
MPKRNRPPPLPSRDVEIEIDGRRHSGRYTVDRDVLTVSHANGQIATQVGNTPVENLARQLLSELVRRPVS